MKSRCFVITEPYIGKFQERQFLLGPDGILLEPIAVGLCGSDKRVWQGAMPAAKYPRIPGHEVVARVIDSTNNSIPVSEIVFVNPYTACGKCYACLNGRSNCCRFNQTFGVQRDGVLQTLFAAHPSDVWTIGSDRLRKAKPWIFCLTEPLALASHIIARTAGDGALWGRDCLVIGAGNVGGFLIPLLVKIGAKVTAITRTEKSAERARQLGAQAYAFRGFADEERSTPAQEKLLHHLLSETGGEGFPFVFEVAGAYDAPLFAVRAAAFGGRVMVAGNTDDFYGVNEADVVFKELDILGCRNSLGQFSAAMNLLAENPKFWSGLVTHRFPFEKSDEAFHLIEEGGYGKIVIDFGGRSES